MKSLFERAKQTHTAMMQKVKDAFQCRDDMKMQMEEAFTIKEAVGTETDFCGFDCRISIIMPRRLCHFSYAVIGEEKKICLWLLISLLAFCSFSQSHVWVFCCFQALSAMDQLRAHCAIEISELERVVGSQQELSAALNQTYPQLVTEIRHVALFIYSVKHPP